MLSKRYWTCIFSEKVPFLPASLSRVQQRSVSTPVCPSMWGAGRRDVVRRVVFYPFRCRHFYEATDG